MTTKVIGKAIKFNRQQELLISLITKEIGLDMRRSNLPMKYFLFLLLYSLNPAYATVMDGNEFLSNHKENTMMARQYLIGYMAGNLDALEISNPSLIKFIGPNLKMSQTVDAISVYLEKNPQIRHYAAASIIPPALKAQFKC